MFGIGFPELIVICIVALIFIGPKKLPEMMRQGGKLFVQLRRTANDLKSSFDQVVHEAEEEMRRSEAEALRQAILADHVKAPKLLESSTAGGDSTDLHGDHHSESAHDAGLHDDLSLHPHVPEGAQPFNPSLLKSEHSASSAPPKTQASAKTNGEIQAKDNETPPQNTNPK